MSDLGIEVVSLLADFLALGGALLFLVSAIGLLRLPDFFCRVHAPTKAATLGVLLLGLSAVVRSLAQGDLVWLEDVAILLFVCLTIPVSSQVLARAALRCGVAQAGQTKQAAPNEPSR